MLYLRLRKKYRKRLREAIAWARKEQETSHRLYESRCQEIDDNAKLIEEIWTLREQLRTAHEQAATLYLAWQNAIGGKDANS